MNGAYWIFVRNMIVGMLLLVAILLPRGIALDRLVTPDETRWTTRAANFYYALARRDFANTYQWNHPGVIPMWAGTLAFLYYYPAYRDQATGQLNWWHEDVGTFLSDRGYDPLRLLVIARLNMVVLITLAMLAAFLAASQLFGFWPAVLGFLFIAVDPFHIALSRLLHVDGTVSSLMLLALLAFLSYLYRGRQWRYLFLSGTAAGLAWLTKSPALFLIPFIGLLVVLELVEKWWHQKRLSGKDVWQAVFPLVLWGGTGMVVFVIFWPAMWAEPVSTLRTVLGAMLGYAAQGHESPLYFNGQVYTGDPGAHFYPITYLWRSTPAVLLGLLLALLLLVIQKSRLINSTHRRPLAMLLCFTVMFTLFMTLGAKKFDRYLLPIYPALDLVAGVGWFTAANAILQRSPMRLMQVVVPLLLLMPLAAQGTWAVLSYPYYLSYYNPLMGGTPRAPKVMIVGWGEGLDQAAHFLNRQPDAAERQVATGVWANTLSYFYKGPVLETRFEAGSTRIEEWTGSDYYLVYINQEQRERVSHDVVEYFAALTPIHVIRINGLDYVYIYEIRGLPPPDFMLSTASRRTE
jgi:hypothetical protein